MRLKASMLRLPPPSRKKNSSPCPVGAGALRLPLGSNCGCQLLEVVLVNLDDLDRPLGLHTNAVFDHQFGKQRTIDKNHPGLNRPRITNSSGAKRCRGKKPPYPIAMSRSRTACSKRQVPSHAAASAVPRRPLPRCGADHHRPARGVLARIHFPRQLLTM